MQIYTSKIYKKYHFFEKSSNNLCLVNKKPRAEFTTLGFFKPGFFLSKFKETLTAINFS